MNHINLLEQYFKPTLLLRAMVFGIVLFLAMPTSHAQESLNVSNSIQILATQFEVKAYPNGTFPTEKAFLTLHEEMDKMGNEYSRGLKYRYYWLVSVDLKRKKLPLEESLLKNLNKVGKEYGVPNSTLQKLYRNTISIL